MSKFSLLSDAILEYSRGIKIGFDNFVNLNLTSSLPTLYEKLEFPACIIIMIACTDLTYTGAFESYHLK